MIEIVWEVKMEINIEFLYLNDLSLGQIYFINILNLLYEENQFLGNLFFLGSKLL